MNYKYYIAMIFVFVFFFANLKADNDFKFALEPSQHNLVKQALIETRFKSFSDKIQHISSVFLGVNYQENTLTHSRNQEKLVVNFANVDCMTYLEYVQAMLKSTHPQEFKKSLKQVRYSQNRISFASRKHFFNDWLANNNLQDVTVSLARNNQSVLTISKKLNQKNSNQKWLPQVPINPVKINYIKPENLNYSQFKTGDLLGIYSNKKGLDVSHVGLIIKNKNQLFYRHASKIKRKVVDVNLKKYLNNKAKKGVIVYRYI